MHARLVCASLPPPTFSLDQAQENGDEHAHGGNRYVWALFGLSVLYAIFYTTIVRFAAEGGLLGQIFFAGAAACDTATHFYLVMSIWGFVVETIYFEDSKLDTVLWVSCILLRFLMTFFFRGNRATENITYMAAEGR